MIGKIMIFKNSNKYPTNYCNVLKKEDRYTRTQKKKKKKEGNFFWIKVNEP